eukprot:TRINITY_DN25632_c0_g1_i1.p1 TRINITY_DN25632_c0_g1~~TRINITY_DN25632_c0_g1_i1.p1  ORF type:complete len:495 (+),score=30.40 TRINITY_DN25632_c0_g1_i1:21-1505(+)
MPKGLLKLFIFFLLHRKTWVQVMASTAEQQQILLKGFTATPNPSISTFQNLLTDPTGDFSLGFLRVNETQLLLAILHIPSSDPLWIAQTTRFPRWSNPTKLTFDGTNLALTGPDSVVFWSTQISTTTTSSNSTTSNTNRLILLNTSNLQIQTTDDSQTLLWESFNFPTDTLVQNQNFTLNMSLSSSNRIYSMKLVDNYLGLYADFKPPNSNQIYWKHKPWEVKFKIEQDGGPIYARVSSHGFLGLYQTEIAPLDVLSFDTFQRSTGFRRVKLESDGNLRGYYWSNTSWILDFQAITDTCEKPSACGPYSLCVHGKGCACLDERMEYRAGWCTSPGSDDFCREGSVNGFWVLRRKGVELPYKEWMGFEKMASLEECVGMCERNCSCFGAVYNNVSGYCYGVDYAIQTLVGVGDESQVGFFKVRRAGGKKRKVGLGVGVGLLVGMCVIFVGVLAVGVHRVWRKKRRGFDGLMSEGLSPGPYINLDERSGSLEMCKR